MVWQFNGNEWRVAGKDGKAKSKGKGKNKDAAPIVEKPPTKGQGKGSGKGEKWQCTNCRALTWMTELDCHCCFVRWNANLPKTPPGNKKNLGRQPHLPMEVWNVLSRADQTSYRNGEITGNYARKLAKGAEQSSKPQTDSTIAGAKQQGKAKDRSRADDATMTTASSEESAEDMDVTMVPRRWEVNFSVLFNAFTFPSAEQDERSPEEALRAMLAPAARASTATKALQKTVSDLKAALERTSDPLLPELASNELKEKEAALQATEATGDEAAEAHAEVKALTKALSNLKTDGVEGHRKDGQHDEQAAKKVEEFRLMLADHRSNLALVEQQFSGLAARHKAKWQEKRERKGKKIAAMCSVAEAGIAASNAKLASKTPMVTTLLEPANIPVDAGDDKQPRDAAVQQAATKVEETARKEKAELDHCQRQQTHYQRIASPTYRMLPPTSQGRRRFPA